MLTARQRDAYQTPAAATSTNHHLEKSAATNTHSPAPLKVAKDHFCDALLPDKTLVKAMRSVASFRNIAAPRTANSS